jgi:hypothetical protein
MLIFLGLFLCGMLSTPAAEPVRVSVYCGAGEIQACMSDAVGREAVLRALGPLRVSRLFLEGRRGDQSVSPGKLVEARDFFRSKGIHCSGGIATVPGASFAVRQKGGLDWLNWESQKTQKDVASFFSENAPLFPELIVDDFFCTGDVSSESVSAKGSRSWGEYRRDLLVSLMEPCMFKPARKASHRTRVIIKFPQWYDLFHVYGYDPPRMIKRFSEVWVGTEVRNPTTRRMGFVQPTQGYVNYRWLSSMGGRKVRGAWFDHIECNAQQFVDQAYASVLAGAPELTLFNLSDVVGNHPGNALLAQKLPDLGNLARRVRGQKPRGIAFYRPPGSDSEENVNLADYLAVIGLPLVPGAEYPVEARVVFLPVQAAGDPKLLLKIHRHLRAGGTLVVTPALLRALGPEGLELAGMNPGPASVPASARKISEECTYAGERAGDWTLAIPLEIDGGLKTAGAAAKLIADTEGVKVPFLAARSVGPGQVLVLNLRTFSQQDFLDAHEYLLAPKLLGITKIPQSLADRLRGELLAPLGVEFHAPPGVQLVLLGNAKCVYSYLDTETRIQLGAETISLGPHAWAWR